VVGVSTETGVENLPIDVEARSPPLGGDSSSSAPRGAHRTGPRHPLVGHWRGEEPRPRP